MSNLISTLISVLLLGFLAACATAPNHSGEVAKIATDDLASRLDSPGTVVVDVRSGPDWANSDRKIRGAVREDAANVASWYERYSKSDSIVFYCA